MHDELLVTLGKTHEETLKKISTAVHRPDQVQRWERRYSSPPNAAASSTVSRTYPCEPGMTSDLRERYPPPPPRPQQHYRPPRGGTRNVVFREREDGSAPWPHAGC